jgi:hypothetical protein
MSFFFPFFVNVVRQYCCSSNAGKIEYTSARPVYIFSAPEVVEAYPQRFRGTDVLVQPL